ncbi:MAG: hypothetical protein GXO10_05205 [Crenarchaeota archaeon]|nr:hypothetical protein [Thermoproteota archaeon]
MKILLLPSLHGEPDLYLNLILIGEYLEARGHRVKIFDVNFYYNVDSGDIRVEELEHDIKEYVEWADIIALSSYKMFITNDLLLFNIIKRIRPDVPVLIGGWGPSCFPEQYLKLFKPTAILRGVHGQTLRAFLNILDNIGRGDISNIKSVGVIDEKGRIIINKLDIVPQPSEFPTISWRVDKFDVDIERYVEDEGILFPFLCSLASCPKYYIEPCIYCSIGEQIRSYVYEYGEECFEKIVKPRLLYFNIDRVIREIKNAYNVYTSIRNARRFSIMIVDDCMTPGNFKKLLEALSSEGLLNDISIIKFQTRPEMVKHVLNIVRKYEPHVEHKLIIDVGIEYFNDNDLRRSRRGYDTKIVNECLKSLSESNVKWTMYVILTTPWTSPDELAENIESSLEWSFHTYLLRTNPFIFEEATPLRHILSRDDFKYVTIDSVELPIRPRFKLSKKELEKYLEIIENYIREIDEFKRELINSDGRGDRGSRLDLVLRSLEDLQESLLILREAVIEDLEET